MPSVAPTITEIVSVGSGVVTVEWGLLTKRQANGVIVGYKVLYSVSNGGGKEQTKVSDSGGTYISGLQGHTQYDIRVRVMLY